MSQRYNFFSGHHRLPYERRIRFRRSSSSKFCTKSLALRVVMLSAVIPLRRAFHFSSTSSSNYYFESSTSSALWLRSSSTSTAASSSNPSRLADLLPNDLDVVLKATNDPRRRRIFLNALGVQLLLFGGWTKNNSDKGGWSRRLDNQHQLSLQQRLEYVTPTFKPGGTLDYTFFFDKKTKQQQQDNNNILNIFQEETLCDDNCHSIADLTDSLQDNIGLSPKDFDDSDTRTALQAMMKWNSYYNNIQRQEEEPDAAPETLFIFSFDATPHCYSLKDCPLPGPTNELLAATAADYVQKKNPATTKIAIIAQWEVAAALHKHYSIPATIIPVGTPGTFQNTAEIFELMLCEYWTRKMNHYKESREAANAGAILLLAHPDHLRRVYWTSQTILMHQKKNQHQQQQKNDLSSPSSCKVAPPLNAKLDLIPAMNPYHLDWTISHHSSSYDYNLFFDKDMTTTTTTTTVQTQGQQIQTNWYQEPYGFFPDGDPQKWTHQREVWILYDQWAIAKGLVTGTIDPNLIV